MSDDKTGIFRIETTRPDGPVERPDALLVLLHPASFGLGRRYALGHETSTIGRSPDAEVFIESDSVSRRHAQVLRAGTDWWVEDAGSTNGTLLNGAPLAGRTKLADGDLLAVGEVVLKFLTGQNLEVAYHEEIYERSILDGLTEIHNKLYLTDFLSREVARANRHHTPLSFLLLDLDHFKRVNDTLGHLAGDAVLKGLCRRLKPRMRREDLFARYGGEELACVLPDTDLVGALALAESLRAVVAADGFPYHGHLVPITISIGAAGSIPWTRLTPADLIRQADASLYAAKQGGRNRVAG